MLERAVFQQFILDNLGNIQPNAQVTVRNASDDSIADIYESLTATPTKSNPFNVGASALARFYAAPGRYNIRFWKDGKEATLENVEISSKSHRLDLNKSTGAELVAYNPTISGLNVFDVQSAIDETVINIDDIESKIDETVTNIDDIESKIASIVDNRLTTNPYAVSDAMYSWWSRPMVMRYTDDTYNRTYQTFTQRSGAVGIIIHDHNTGTTDRFLLDSQRVPDDHNAGCVCVGSGKVVVVFGGRSNTAAPVDNCLICEWNINDSPNGGSFNKYYLDIGRDYPNLYQYENDAFLLVSQRGANGFTTGHSFKLNSWPATQGGWSIQRDLFSTSASPDWTYVTSRRRVSSPSIIDIAVGFHPEFQSIANIYKGQIRHVGGAEPWRVYSNGSEIANMHTGAGLPLVPSDLELAYDAAAGEKTRLFDVKDDAFVFAVYSGSDNSTAQYKYTRKTNGTWSTGTIGPTGKAFFPSSSYWGGAAISENSIGQVTTAAAQGIYFRFKNYVTTNDGLSWSEIDEYLVSGQAGSTITHGRPLPENASLNTITRADGINYIMTGWAGRYSTSDFTDYSTNILTITPWNSNTAMMPWQANGQVLSSKPDSFGADLQASVASQGGSFVRERSGDFASSGISAIARNTGAMGSRNITFTGVVAASGLSDTWIMGSVGSNASTVGKNYSAVIGSDQVSIDTGDSNGVVGNVIAASGAGTSISSASSYSMAAAGLNNSIDGDFSVIFGGQGNSIAIASAGYGGVYSGFNNIVTNSRGTIIGSRDSLASQTGAGVYNSDTSNATNTNSMVLASTGTVANLIGSVVGGDGLSPSTANKNWEISSVTGDLKLSGTITENNNFADIAKMIKNGEASAIEDGYLLTLVGDEVLKAKEGEPVHGIVAATPSMVHNDTPFHWQGRYELDDFGRIIWVDAPCAKWEGYNGTISDCPHAEADWPEGAQKYTRVVPVDENTSENVMCVMWEGYNGLKERFTFIPSFAAEYVGKKKKENPLYNPAIKNISRRERPDEWTCAGVHGVIRARIDSTVAQKAVDDAKALRQNVYIEPSVVDGVGRLAAGVTNAQVMAVEKEYDQSKGYGVALCLIT